MEIWDCIQLAALRDVYFSRIDRDGGDPHYVYRRIFRWYSKMFATPLHTVEDLPLEDVLRAWYEQTFEEMEEKELEDRVRKAGLSEAEQARLDREEDAAKAEEVDAMREAEEDNARAAAISRKLGNIVRPIQEQLRAMRPLREDVQIVPVRPNMPVIPPDIKMTFLAEDDDSFERALEGDSFGLLDLPGKKR